MTPAARRSSWPAAILRLTRVSAAQDWISSPVRVWNTARIHRQLQHAKRQFHGLRFHGIFPVAKVSDGNIHAAEPDTLNSLDLHVLAQLVNVIITIFRRAAAFWRVVNQQAELHTDGGGAVMADKTVYANTGAANRQVQLKHSSKTAGILSMIISQKNTKIKE